MFLFERLLGIACYLLVLLFVFCIIYYKKIRVKDALMFYVLILAVMAYFYEPYETADLYRIRNLVEAFSRYEFSDFSKLVLVNNSSPAAYCLFWIIGKIGNVNLLPALAVIITYSVFFYILFDSAERYQIGPRGVAIILFFVMSTGNYMMVISNIRTMIAISFLCICFYRESVWRKFNLWHILLYVTATLLHNFALVLLVVRCGAFILSSAIKQKWKLIVFILLFITGGVLVLKYEWLFDAVFDKALGYLTGDTYSYIWEYIIGVIACVVEVEALWLFRKINNKDLKEHRTFLLLCVGLSIVFMTQFSIFHRLVTYIAPMLVVPLISSELSVLSSRKNQSTNILLLSVLMLFIACFRGSLSSLKFFVL